VISSLKVRPLDARGIDAWLLLWDDCNAFYRNKVTTEATQTTFCSLQEGAEGSFGLVAEAAGGLVELALMMWTWYANPAFFRNPLSATPVQAPGTVEALEEE
jgi:hypothetical protein